MMAIARDGVGKGEGGRGSMYTSTKTVGGWKNFNTLQVQLTIGSYEEEETRSSRILMYVYESPKTDGGGWIEG